MPSNLERRLATLEALEKKRSANAIDWALAQLGPEEFACFVAFWHREQARPGIYPDAGDESAAVDRYTALVELGYVQGRVPNSRRI
jgi:hypothetical protein